MSATSTLSTRRSLSGRTLLSATFDTKMSTIPSSRSQRSSLDNSTTLSVPSSSRRSSTASSKLSTISKSSSKLARKSQIPVKANKSLIPVPIKGNARCHHHPTKEVTFVCEDCDGDLVCVDCVTSLHQRHGLVKLSDIVHQKKDAITKYMAKAAKTGIPKVKKQIKFANERIMENKNSFKNVIAEIEQQGRDLKQEIDKITKQFVQEVKKVEDFNNERLSKYYRDLQEVLADFNLQVHECKRVLHSGTDSEIYILEKRVSSGLRLPQVPTVHGASFDPGNMYSEQITQAYGSLTLPEDDAIDMDDRPPTLGSIFEEESGSLSGMLSSDLSTHYQLSKATHLISEFQHKTDIHSVSNNNDQAWILDIFSYAVMLVNSKGKVKERVELNVCPSDMCISPITGTLWLCSEDDYKVREVIGKTTKVRFHSTDLPLSMCVTYDNKIMVGTHKTVTVYTPEGEVVQRSTTDRTKRQMVTFPRHIKQCPLSGNIAVADGDNADWGGDDKPHITVMDSNLVLLYRYRGEVISNTPYDDTAIIPGFDPYDMVYDSNGNLLVSDRSSCAILLIGREGKYLGTIYADKGRPVALSIQNNNALWVGYDRGKVKILKYTS